MKMSNGDKLNVVPEVKRFVRKRGYLEKRSSVMVEIPECGRRFEWMFKSGVMARLNPQICNTDGIRVRAGGHVIKIMRNRMEIAAKTERACFDALLTLRQLLENHEAVPCGVITDWPDTPMRGFHLDCKGGFPEMRDLYEFCRRLIDLKFNCILLEYEDRFPYTSIPEVVVPGSPSLKEWKRFLGFLRKNCVKIIPLVQTAGHLEFLLRYDKYAKYREYGCVDEICQSDPRARGVVLGMLDEVMDVHKGDEIIHIGADETWFLASCSRCRKRLARGLGKLDIYTRHISEVAGHVIKNGFRPMMWCDMFWRHDTPEDVEKLPREVIMAEWVYSGTHRGSPGAKWAGKYVLSDRYGELLRAGKAIKTPGAIPVGAPTVSEIEPGGRRFLRKYWDVDSKTGLGTISPYPVFFREKGFDVWGVSAVRAAHRNVLLGPHFRAATENAYLWGRNANELGVSGLIASSWSRGTRLRALYAPWETGMEGAVVAAQVDWNRSTSYKQCVQGMGMHLYGTHVHSDVETILHESILSCSPPETGVVDRLSGALARIEQKATRGKERLYLLRALMEYGSWRWKTDFELSKLEGYVFRKHHKMFLERGAEHKGICTGHLKRIRAGIEEMRDRTAETMGKYFRMSDLEEYLDSRFMDLEFRADNLEKCLL